MSVSAIRKTGSPKIFALSKAFALQYASLILIILAAVSGAFIRGSKHDSGPAPESKSALRPAPKVVASLSYPKFFSTGGGIADLDSLAAIKIFMQEHDVDADIELGADVPTVKAETALAAALFRGRELRDLLVKSGIPSSAIKIFAADSLSPEALHVDFKLESKELP